MRAIKKPPQGWNQKSDKDKLEYLYEHSETLHERLDELSATVETLRRQVDAQRAGRS